MLGLRPILVPALLAGALLSPATAVAWPGDPIVDAAVALSARQAPAPEAPGPQSVAEPEKQDAAEPEPVEFGGPPAPPPGGWVSVARGTPNDGSLVRGVQLPASSPAHLTWDPILERSPNRAFRRFGTDRLVTTVLRVATEFRNAHPDRAPLLIADLSRPRGGNFDQRFGGLGHLSHRNGLDVDVMYPRKDGAPAGAGRASEVDRELAQELVDRFLAAGAQVMFVGPRLGLEGPAEQVVPLRYHDTHVHVRLPALRAR